MTDAAQPARYTDNILATLRGAGRALTAQEIFDACDAIDDRQRVHSGLHHLRKNGQIVAEISDEISPNHRPQRAYRLADGPPLDSAALFRRHRAVAEELTASAELDAGPIGTRLSPADDPASDEVVFAASFEGHPWGGEDRRRSVPAPNTFLARLVRDLPDPAPRLLEAAAFAEVMTEVVARLEAGRALPPHPDLIACFAEMRDVFRGCA